jgi:7-cyano-7-deazaguanine synthase
MGAAQIPIRSAVRKLQWCEHDLRSRSAKTASLAQHIDPQYIPRRWPGGQSWSDKVPTTSPKAIVLLSGGLDSTTTLAMARSLGFTPVAMTFRYGQRHEAEIAAAKRVAERAGVEQHVIVDIDLRTLGGSALTDSSISVPKDRGLDDMSSGIPVTYVPARNTVFLSFALAWAEVLGASDIFIGVNAVDYSGYPDCRPEFIEAFERMANLATAAAVEGRQRIKIHTPLMALKKSEIVAAGRNLGVDYSITLTCYDPGDEGVACGHCDACQLRLRGFHENGIADPAPYQIRQMVP